MTVGKVNSVVSKSRDKYQPSLGHGKAWDGVNMDWQDFRTVCILLHCDMRFYDGFLMRCPEDKHAHFSNCRNSIKLSYLSIFIIKM